MSVSVRSASSRLLDPPSAPGGRPEGFDCAGSRWWSVAGHADGLAQRDGDVLDEGIPSGGTSDASSGQPEGRSMVV